MKDTYTLKIGGIERELQKFPVSDKMDIAAFILSVMLSLQKFAQENFSRKFRTLIT